MLLTKMEKLYFYVALYSLLYCSFSTVSSIRNINFNPLKPSSTKAKTNSKNSYSQFQIAVVAQITHQCISR